MACKHQSSVCKGFHAGQVCYLLAMSALGYIVKRGPIEIKYIGKYILLKENRKSFLGILFLMNILSSGACMFLGDVIQQNIEFRSKKRDRYDWRRIGRMFTVGLMIGPVHHYFYMGLDKWIPKTNFKAILIKLITDELIVTPIVLFVFFYGMGLLEKKPLRQCINEIKSKFRMTYLVDWMYWPPVQFINFYLLPRRYRVIYVNLATLIFNVFLSYMKHFDQLVSDAIGNYVIQQSTS